MSFTRDITVHVPFEWSTFITPDTSGSGYIDNVSGRPVNKADYITGTLLSPQLLEIVHISATNGIDVARPGPDRIFDRNKILSNINYDANTYTFNLASNSEANLNKMEEIIRQVFASSLPARFVSGDTDTTKISNSSNHTSMILLFILGLLIGLLLSFTGIFGGSGRNTRISPNKNIFEQFP